VPDAGILAVGLGEWTARLVATGLIDGAKATAIPRRSGKPRFWKGWSARESTNDRTETMHGLATVMTPPK